MWQICPICKGLGYVERVIENTVICKRTERTQCHFCKGEGKVLK
jgi:DnaJ-class molecular chaperone